MGRFFHKPAYSIFAKPSEIHFCIPTHKAEIRIDHFPRFWRRNVKGNISPEVTKPSSVAKQLQSSSKMRFLHKIKAFKKKKKKMMLVNKRKATTT